MTSRLARVLARSACVGLRFGPAAFRAEYGPEVVDALARLLEDERRRRGLGAMAIVWMRSVIDGVRVARRELGAAGAPAGGRRPLASWPDDLRTAVRAARRSPGFSATMVLTLVFGLALASAIFAFGDGYVFRPLPFSEPERLYVVRVPNARPPFLPMSDVLALRDGPLARLGLAVTERGSPVRSGFVRVGNERIQTAVDGVGEDAVAVLGIPMALGRSFTHDDFAATEPYPVWLSHRYWRTTFAGDPGILGRVLTVETGAGPTLVQVVGVTDRTITTLSTNFGRSNRLPDIFAPSRPSQPDPAGSRTITIASPIVRLPPDMTVAQAEAAIDTVLGGIEPRISGQPRQVSLTSLQAETRAAGRPTARLFLLGAALAMMLVTVNLVHLLLGRSVARTPEIATRLALGASRWRIGRMLLMESLLYGAVGIAGGLLLGRWLTALIASRIPERGDDSANLALVAISFDGRAVTFALLMGLVVSVFGAAWPAWRAARQPLAAAARAAGGSTGRVSRRVSRFVLVSETALATVVLLGVVFMGLGIWRFLSQPLGYDLDGRFLVQLTSKPGATPFLPDWDEVREAIGALPGVAAVSGTIWQVREPVGVGDRALTTDEAWVVGLEPGSAGSFGFRLVDGRWPEPEEVRALEPVALVDDRFAATVWPNGTPLGRSLRVGDSGPYQVVGVVEHRRLSLVQELPPTVYVPQPSRGERGIRVWAPGLSADALAAQLAPVLAASAPGFSVAAEPWTFDRQFNDELTTARFQTPVLLVLGLFAFSVAGVGLFGLVSYLVEQRTREFGIRMALGAGARAIWTDVLRSGAMPATGGMILGLAVAIGLERVVRSATFGWQSSGPVAILLVMALMIGVALLAVIGPARRALRIDPTIALKAE